MSISSFLKRGILVKQESSEDEIQDLLKIVERDINDSAKNEISFDWQFGIAYNAALKLATILVRASHYRIKGGSHHMNTIAMIPLLLGESKREDSDYLDTCRRKRNTVEYESVGGATKADVQELREFVIEFKNIILGWLDE